MRKLFFIPFILLSSLSWSESKGGGGSTRGNGGGSRHLEEFLLPLRQSYGQLSEVDMSDRVNQFFNRGDNLDCEILENYFSMATGLLEFYRSSGFEFKDSKGKVVDLSKIDFVDLRKKYSDPRTCSDKKYYPGADSYLEVTDEAPPAEYEQDLMALNFEDTKKIIVYRRNWKSAEVLKRETCRNLGEDIHTSKTLQRSCLFVTHLSIAMHELLSIAGIAQEKHRQYEISSQFESLVTLNKKTPAPHAELLIEHLVKHYLRSFEKVKAFDQKTYELSTLLTTKPLLSGDALNKAHKDWEFAFLDMNLMASRFRVAYFNINIFLEFIIPNSFVPYKKFVSEYQKRYLHVTQPRLGFSGLISKSKVDGVLSDQYAYENISDIQRLLFEISFFTDLTLGEQYEISADIYEMNSDRLDINKPIQTQKTADEIEGWGCIQFPGLNGRRNTVNGR